MKFLPRLKIGTLSNRPIYIKGDYRYRHFTIIGQSGTGKSVWLSNAWWQDTLFRIPKIMIEPSGSLSQDCYSISKGKALYCSVDNPISLNPLRQPYSTSQISENVAEAINQVVQQTTPNQDMTVKMRSILDVAIKDCIERNRFSLINVKDFIMNMKGNHETRDGILHRLKFILEDDAIREILCGSDALNVGELIKSRQSLIIDCSRMGLEKMIFIGSLITQAVKNYFRYEEPVAPLVLYIDECQLFVNMHFFDILKEGRKYKISAMLATQDFATIDDRMSRVLLNNGNLIGFKEGFVESVLMSREMFFDSELMMRLKPYCFLYKTPDGSGAAKALRPPIFKKRKVRKVEPQPKTNTWFELESYRPKEPTG